MTDKELRELREKRISIKVGSSASDVMKRYERRAQLSAQFTAQKALIMESAYPIYLVHENPFWIERKYPKETERLLREIEKLEEQILAML